MLECRSPADFSVPFFLAPDIVLLLILVCNGPPSRTIASSGVVHSCSRRAPVSLRTFSDIGGAPSEGTCVSYGILFGRCVPMTAVSGVLSTCCMRRVALSRSGTKKAGYVVLRFFRLNQLRTDQ